MSQRYCFTLTVHCVPTFFQFFNSWHFLSNSPCSWQNCGLAACWEVTCAVRYWQVEALELGTKIHKVLNHLPPFTFRRGENSNVKQTGKKPKEICIEKRTYVSLFTIRFYPPSLKHLLPPRRGCCMLFTSRRCYPFKSYTRVIKAVLFPDALELEQQDHVHLGKNKRWPYWERLFSVLLPVLPLIMELWWSEHLWTILTATFMSFLMPSKLRGHV